MRRFVVAAVIAIAGLFVATPARAAAITFNSGSYNVGQTLSVDILLTGTTPSIAIYAFDFVFNQSVLRLENIVRGSLFGGFGAFNTTEGSVSGEVDASIYPFAIPASTPVTLATLQFTAVGAGNGGLQLTDSDLLGSFYGIPYHISHSVTNGSILVAGSPTPVPEPGTITLMGAGALAVVRQLRRRRKAASAVVA